MYQKIMVPLDGSELAECVLPHVESVIKGCDPKSVVFVCVVEPPQLWHINETDTGHRAKEVLEGIEEQHEHELSQARKYLDAIPGKTHLDARTIQTEVLSGQTAQSLIDYAEKQGIDLIIMATHGRSGPSRWVWGSVADRLLHGTCVPVLMVRAPGCVAGI